VTTLSDRRQAALARIDELWWLHEHRDPNARTDGRCTAFVVDSRFVKEDDIELRLAVSYGDNPFTEEMNCGFVPPPVCPGTHVFGIHVVGTRDSLITLFDQWYDAREATGHETPEAVESRAREILASISDTEYANSTASFNGQHELRRTPDRSIEDFEILPGESL
jgi:hypothetical protein